MLTAVWEGLRPVLPVLAPLLTALVVLMCPLPGRGPGGARRDRWRGFRFDPRRTVLARAGHRCEAAAFLAWGRCGDPATEVDHVYPWSKGGPTVVSNGQALCKGHNRAKSNLTPPWWYVLALERRRRRSFPVDAEPRVRARMNDAERAARRLSGR